MPRGRCTGGGRTRIGGWASEPLPMKRQSNKEPALFPPGWLDKTSKDPALASEEILYLTHKLKKTEAENSQVRKQRDELEQRVEQFTHKLMANSVARDKTQEQIARMEHISAMLEQRARDAEQERDKASASAAKLRQRVRLLKEKLRTNKRGADGGALSVIRKLALDRAVGKRLAACVHPDKVPAELTGAALEVFRFVQKIRESSDAEA